MIAVALMGLILTFVAHEQRLRHRAVYHEGMYFERVTPVTAQTPRPGAWKIKMRDGSWSAPHLKTPEAEWHQQMKEEYQGAIIRSNQLLIALLVGTAFLCLISKAVWTRLHPSQDGVVSSNSSRGNETGEP